MKTTALATVLAVAVLTGWLASQTGPRPETVGPTIDGGFLLNSGWKITPAGRQVPLDTFPMSSVLSKDGKFLLVLNQGYRPPSISIIRTDTMAETGRVPVKDAWLGLAMSPDGKNVYVGGGSTASVFEFGYENGTLTPKRTIVITPEATRKVSDFIGDVAVSPNGRFLYVAALHNDAIHLINLSTATVTEKFPTGRRPYRILFHPDGKTYFVSSWADGTVYQHKAETGERFNMVRLGQHPVDMVITTAKEPFTHRLFVAAANTNAVYSVGIQEDRTLRLSETINVSMTPRQPLGMTPSALSLSPDNKRLYVACSDGNTVAVADVSEDTSVVLGFIPTGWYPTGVRTLPDNRLLIFNGLGLRSYPNPEGPTPARGNSPQHGGARNAQYVAQMQTGTMSVIDPFNEEQLDTWSQQVLKNTPYNDAKLDITGSPAPIEHVIYVVKENRTYDQVLGSLGKGNGDPSLTLFDEKSAPNHHKLARDFVLFDNFFVNADVSADGHAWTMSAIANDYVQKLWPNSYGGRRKLSDYAGIDIASRPPAGYIWTAAAQAGVTMRNYGNWVANTPKPGAPGEAQIAQVRDPILAKVTNMKFRGFDLEYLDTERIKYFLEDLKQFEATGQMPRLTLVRLGNDHTSGLAAGKRSPLSMMADNDQALGQLVEAVSKSKFWPKTAIFVLEDDAQNGPDHVDAHRAPAYILSPYTRRGVIDSTMYNTTSMLRTMELILGLRPMTHFDAGARPMWAAFSKEPNPAPWQAAPTTFPLDRRNPAQTAEAIRSAKLDFSEADEIDDDELNDILWRGIRGTEPPAPVRSFFAH
ncbi:MAG: bifunctional YncE family protein/alkaline phosphatase family protein [Bryobacteraceae bacterium]|nr:bifunctional YncE family protein/alkaline phosphatase family protein [Bryobacteraceae bacterium]